MIILLSWIAAGLVMNKTKTNGRRIFKVDEFNFVPLLITIGFAVYALFQTDTILNKYLLSYLPWLLLNVMAAWHGTASYDDFVTYKDSSVYKLGIPFLIIAIYYMWKDMEIINLAYYMCSYMSGIFVAYLPIISILFGSFPARKILYPLIFLATMFQIYNGGDVLEVTLAGANLILCMIINSIFLYFPLSLLYKFTYKKAKERMSFNAAIDFITDTNFPISVLLIWSYFFTFIFSIF